VELKFYKALCTFNPIQFTTEKKLLSGMGIYTYMKKDKKTILQMKI